MEFLLHRTIHTFLNIIYINLYIYISRRNFCVLFLQPFYKYYSSKTEADKKKDDDGSAAENYLRLYWTVFKQVCNDLWLLFVMLTCDMTNVMWIDK